MKNKTLIKLRGRKKQPKIAPYRIYSDAEIDQFVKEDVLDKSLVERTKVINLNA